MAERDSDSPGGIDAHPDFPAIFQQAREEVWGEFAPRYEAAVTRGNAGAAERIQARVDERARQMAAQGVRALDGLGLGRGSAIPSLGEINPDLSLEDVRTSMPPPDSLLGTGPAPRARGELLPVPLPPLPSPNPNAVARGTALQAQSETDRVESGLTPMTQGNEALLHASGLPMAMEAAQSFAQARETGDPMKAASGALQAAAAAPTSRWLRLPGIMVSEAEAQPRDPRLQRIDELETDIRRREKVIQTYGAKQFPSRTAREAANKVELDSINAARTERDRLRTAMDDESTSAAAQEEAQRLATEWRNTPTAKAYPAAPATSAAIGATLGATMANRFSASMVTRYNNAVKDAAQRWGASVERANNTRLSADKRRQAIVEARKFQEQFNTLKEQGPMSHWAGTGMAVAGTELGIAAPTAVDYLTSTPGSPLRKETLRSVNPVENPGEVIGRYGFGLGLGAGIGELASRWPYRGMTDPLGYAAETEALARRRARAANGRFTGKK